MGSIHILQGINPKTQYREFSAYPFVRPLDSALTITPQALR